MRIPQSTCPLNALRFAATFTGLLFLTMLAACGGANLSPVSSRQPEARPAGLSLVGVTPSTGAAAGGDAVTISGKGFSNGMQVTLDGKAAAAVTVRDATEAHFLTPPHAAGKVKVAVSTPDGKSAELDNAFTYVDSPTVTSLYPNTGLSGGGTLVTILGSNFQPGVRVSFGDKAAQSLASVTPSVIQALTPAHSTGTVDVIVENPDGAVARLSRGFRFGQILFADGFESSDFSAWRSVSKYSCSEQSSYAVSANQVHGGAFAAEFHYRIPADQCPEHQDTNVVVSQSFTTSTGYPNGLNHFFIRGYVYAKSPEPGGTVEPLQRKLIYFTDGEIPTNWSFVLDTFSSDASGGLNAIALTNTHTDRSQIVYWDIYNLGYDQWYCLELEVKANTPGRSDGAFRLWVNGNQIWERTNIEMRGDHTTGVGNINVGVQVDRTDYLPVDEYRYWDDIVIADAFIGP